MCETLDSKIRRLSFKRGTEGSDPAEPSSTEISQVPPFVISFVYHGHLSVQASIKWLSGFLESFYISWSQLRKAFQLSWGLILCVLDGVVFQSTNAVGSNLIPSRWWSAWPWKSFQIRKRRRGNWTCFLFVNRHKFFLILGILSWKICMTSFRLLEAESKDDCVEVKAALVRIYRHRSKELPARLISWSSALHSDHSQQQHQHCLQWSLCADHKKPGIAASIWQSDSDDGYQETVKVMNNRSKVGWKS